MHRPVWKRGAAWGRQSGLHTLNSGGAAWAEALLGAAVPALLPLRFVLPAGAQGPGGSAESHLLWDHLHAGERSSPLGQERHRAPPLGWSSTAQPGSLALSPEPCCGGCSPAAGASGVSSPPLCDQTLGNLHLCLCLPQHLAGTRRPPCCPAFQHGHGECCCSQVACACPSTQGRSTLHPTWEVSDVSKLGAAPRPSCCLPTMAAAGLPCSSLSP